MSEPTLGDKIRARRAARDAVADATAQVKADGALTRAQQYADAIRVAVRTYVDNQITLAKAAAKTYVDNQIAKLVAANNLKPPQ